MSEQPALHGISAVTRMHLQLFHCKFCLVSGEISVSFDEATTLLFPLPSLASQDHKPTHGRGVAQRGEERIPKPRVSASAMNSGHGKAQLHWSDQ